MKIGSYIVEGMASYGVKTNEGIVDLRKRMGDKYADLLSVLPLAVPTWHVGRAC